MSEQIDGVFEAGQDAVNAAVMGVVALALSRGGRGRIEVEDGVFVLRVPGLDDDFLEKANAILLEVKDD